MTYHQYLQAREFSDSIQYEISAQAKSIIASTNRAASAQMTQMQEIGRSQVDAMVTVSQSVADLRQEMVRGFDEIGSILEYGFSDLMVAASRTNDLLEELLQAVKTPSQTWAYEQFAIGRDAYRRGLYQDALESVGKAIDGFHGNIGYRSEHRFHFLMGLIRLGDFRNNSSEIVDLAQAESAFRLASHYAQHDDPDGAGLALLYAARTANLRGKYELALELADKAEKDGPLAAVLYERAVAQIELGLITEAHEGLKDALSMERNLLVKAAGDPHFATRETFVNGVLEEIRKENYDHVEVMREWCKKQLKSLTEVSHPSSLTGRAISLGDKCADLLGQVQRWLDMANGITRASAILDSFGVIDAFGAAYAVLHDIDKEFKLKAVRDLRGIEEEIKKQQDRKIEEVRTNCDQFCRKLRNLPTFAGIGMGALVILSMLDSGTGHSSLDRLIVAVLGTPLFGWLAFWATAAVVALVCKGKEASAAVDIKKLSEARAQIAAKADKDYSAIDDKTFYQPDKMAKELLPWYVFP